MKHLDYAPLVMDWIDLDYFELEDQTVTDKEKINLLVKDFEDTYCFPADLQRFPNQQVRMAEWLMGLPSSFGGMPFMNYDILQLAIKMQSLPSGATEKEEDKILDNYFLFIANEILKLHRKLNK